MASVTFAERVCAQLVAFDASEAQCTKEIEIVRAEGLDPRWLRLDSNTADAVSVICRLSLDWYEAHGRAMRSIVTSDTLYDICPEKWRPEVADLLRRLHAIGRDATGLPHYIRELKSRYKRGRAMATLEDHLRAKHDGNFDNVLDDVLRDLRGIREVGAQQDTCETVTSTYGSILSRIESLGDTAVTPTGWEGYDSRVRGFGPGQLIVLAGATGVGKSVFGEATTINIVRAGGRVLRCLLEMSVEEEWSRLTSHLVALHPTFAHEDSPLDKIRSGSLTPEQRAVVLAAWEEMTRAGGELHFLKPEEATLIGIRGHGLRLARKGRLHLISVDTGSMFDLPAGVESWHQSDQQGKLAAEFRRIAIEAQAPIMVDVWTKPQFEQCSYVPKDCVHGSSMWGNEADVLIRLYDPDQLSWDVQIIKMRHGPSRWGFSLGFDRNRMTVRNPRVHKETEQQHERRPRPESHPSRHAGTTRSVPSRQQ